MSELYPDLYRTKYPNELDEFVNFLDILSSDGKYIKQYIDAMNKKNYEVARQAITDMPAYSKKILTAQELNKFLDALVALKRYYEANIKPYAKEKQKEWKIYTSDFKYAGVYNPDLKYKKSNYIAILKDEFNYLYIAIKDVPPNTSPIEYNEYWQPLAVKGKMGQSADGVSFVNEWDGSINYRKGDCVQYNSALWLASTNNFAQPPIEDSEFWQLISYIEDTNYITSQTIPIKMKDEDIWLRIIIPVKVWPYSGMYHSGNVFYIP